MKHKKPSVHIVFNERAEFCIDELSEMETCLENALTTYSSRCEAEELPDYLAVEKYKPLIIVTEDKRDFQQFNYIAGDFTHNADTIILWASDKQKPEKSFLPVVSWKQLQNCKDMLDWQRIYQLASAPEQPV